MVLTTILVGDVRGCDCHRGKYTFGRRGRISITGHFGIYSVNDVAVIDRTIACKPLSDEIAQCFCLTRLSFVYQYLHFPIPHMPVLGFTALPLAPCATWHDNCAYRTDSVVRANNRKSTTSQSHVDKSNVGLQHYTVAPSCRLLATPTNLHHLVICIKSFAARLRQSGVQSSG